nr:NAC domain-containing protein 67-like [Ipomoea batatas]
MEKEEATLTMEIEKGLSDRYFKSLPPGIRFRPTDGELMDYLKKKVLKERMPLHRIKTCNIYKYHPNDLCRPDDLAREKESYFFTSRDKKYPNGARPDRKAGDGFWKATGRDMPISCKGEVVGSKKTLVYYEGKHKDVSLHKTNWIMHEYTINPNIKITPVAQGQSDNNNNNDNNILDECVLAKIYEKTTGSKKGADNCSPSQDDTQQILDSEQLPPEEQDNPILEPQEYPTAEQVAPPPPQNPNHQNPMAGATAGGGYNTNMMILQGSEQLPLPLPPPEAQNNPILEPQQYSRATHMGSLTGPNSEVQQPPLPPPEAQENPILEQVAELPPFPYQENPMDVAAAAAATFYSWDAGSYGYESLQTDENFYGINSGAFSFEENNNGFWGSLNGGLEDVVNMYIGNNVNNPSANPHGQANNAGDNVNPSHNPHGPANVSDK